MTDHTPTSDEILALFRELSVVLLGERSDLATAACCLVLTQIVEQVPEAREMVSRQMRGALGLIDSHRESGMVH